MSGKIITLPFSENIINFSSEYILNRKGNIALISGGRRPFLFMKKYLAQKKGHAFYAPSFFTNDDYIEDIVFDNSHYSKIPDIEAAYILFEIIKNETPELLNGKTSFSSFMQWSFEILSFIEQLDLENVSEEKLKNIKANADIGYDVPDNINNLLKNIFKIRGLFHAALEKNFKTTKGYTFLKASLMDGSVLSSGFDEIVLMSPFYLHKTEMEIYKKLYSLNKLTVIIHGNPSEFSILKNIYNTLGVPHTPADMHDNKFELNVYSAYDDQSQAALLKNLISSLPAEEIDKTVVVIPDMKILQSVISEISTITEDYNVSAGYPASKTAVFDVVKSILDAQQTRKGQNYYSKDVIGVLTNPLVKNMRFFSDSSVSRIVTHKIEHALDSSSRSSLSGKLFVSFKEICADEELIEEISKTVTGAWKPINSEKLNKILDDIFEELFIKWEKFETLGEFADVLLSFIENLLNMSIVQSYPLNGEAAEILISTANELKYGEVAKIKFKQEDILNIFRDLIKNKKIALPGSPLKGLQVLGLLESRNLSFENVFIISMTDSALPAVKKESPLVPKDIMYALGIEMAKKEFEIQEYHFKRIISGARKVNLIYPENEKDERSRFIESLLWKKQLERNNINAVDVKKFTLPEISIKKENKKKYTKTESIKYYLKNMKYSYSKIDTYLRCRLEFYFKYILRLEESAEVGQELSGSDIGNFIHGFFYKIFHENFEGKTILEPNFRNEYLSALESEFESSFDLKFREDAFLIKQVLIYRMDNFLKYEKERKYDFIYKCEAKYLSDLQASSGNYKVECIIDRIDKSGEEYIIIDYKTGKVNVPVVSRKFDEIVSSGYDREKIKKAVKSLQLPLYKYIFEKNEEGNVSMCGIYDIKKATISNFSNNEEVYGKCIDMLKYIIDEINMGECFEFDELDKESCKDCKFFYICR